MASGNIFVGQVGVVIRVNLGIALGAADPVRIRYEKPGGATAEWVAAIENAAIGQISYTTGVGDIDEDGKWTFNGIWDPAGDTIHYGRADCLVVKNLGDCD